MGEFHYHHCVFHNYQVKNKELVEDELPARSFMWRKARVNKDGEYEDDDLRDVANKITDREKEIGDGTVKVDQGTDALTLVFGKDHGGRVRGAGKGVTPTKYWHLPPRRGSSKESISQLQKQLDAERRERELMDAEVKDLHKKMQEQGEMMNAIISQLTSQGIIIPRLTTTTNSKFERQNNLKSGLLSSQGTPMTSNPSNGSRQDHPFQKSSKTTRQSSQLTSTSSQQSAGSMKGPPNAMMHSPINFLKSPISQQKSPPSMQEFQTMTSQVVPTGGVMTVKCKLSHPEVRNIVARGTI